MAECFPKDILLRVGGATLHRFGYPAVAGSRRGPVELPLTFARADAATCATYIDRDGVVRVAEANKLRREWVDLDLDGVRESPGLLLEGSRIQLVTQPENMGHADWTLVGTPVLTSGQLDPFGGTAGYLVDDNDGAADEAIQTVVTFTADGTKACSVFIKAGSATVSAFWLRDDTAAVVRAQFTATWTAGVPVVALVAGSGTLYPVQPVANGWYRVLFSANSIVAANTNRFRLFGAATGSAPTGTTRYFGANADNSAFPASYLRSAVTRAADSLTLPFNFGPLDCTVLARVARPVHADAVGTIGVHLGIFQLGTTGGGNCAFFSSASRTIQGGVYNAGGVNASQNIPAGATLTATAQFKTLTTGGKVAIDVGSGLSAFSSAATAFSAFGSQTLRAGYALEGGAVEFYGVLLDLVCLRGLFTLAEASAVA